MSIRTTPLTEMAIGTGNSDPVSQKPYSITMKNYQVVKEEIEKLLTAKVICSSRSCWSVLIIVVPNGDGGKWLVIDYRALNKVTRKFTWLMPKVKDIFSKLNGAKYFTTLDLRAVYHHIPLDKPSIPKLLSTPPLQGWICKGTLCISSSSCIFSRINDWNFEGFWFCKSILRQHNNIQQNGRWTPITHQEGIWETKRCKTLHEIEQMSYLLQRNSMFRTYFKCQGHLPTTLKDTNHSEDAPTNDSQTSLSLPWISWLL